MTSQELLGVWANIAAILTFIVVVCAWARFEWSTWRRRKRLENYLQFRKRSASDRDMGQCSILHLMANVGLTETEILQASFKSRHIRRHEAANGSSHQSGDLLLEYDETGNSH
jgi:hypothetical protein